MVMIHLLDKYLSTLFFVHFAKKSHSGKVFVPILMYHSLSGEPETETHPYFWVNTLPEIFDAQMRFLRENNYQVITLRRAIEIIYGQAETYEKLPFASLRGAKRRGNLFNIHKIMRLLHFVRNDMCSVFQKSQAVKDDRSKYVVITFDDGFRDFYINAFPILQKYGFTATVFLPTKYITDHSQKMDGKEHLSWDEVAELSRQGITFGSHTVGHFQLRDLDKASIKYEIEYSKQVMDSKTDGHTESFSYPFAFPEEDKELTNYLTATLAAYGYKYGVSTRIGRASAADPIYFLKRLPVNSRDDLAFFKAKLEGGYDWLYGVQLKSKIIRSKLRNVKSRT
jgi:peptidoglycan/xylan/chitin deacetylase (PgdA/CDA1 family)